ncbi:MAG TPA: SMUG2 DNA glycosylase family protein [Ferruginibacter sp.]|nr:SMUG2 DNA glycosylase family protein [Ferruginibacter sp.]HRE62850.1 SMUG2 DNA glycosylase family protein [Ferruginibacter sp.]
MAKTFAEKVITYNKNLVLSEKMPAGFKALNPYHDNAETLAVMQQFYHKYYNDHNKRRFIIGINPGRHGAAVTGIPFTDTKRLESVCGIKIHSAHTHEISSVFMYDMMEAYGGAKKFYSECYINSPFPLAIIRQNKNGQWLNANYYDENDLFESLKPFMIQSLKIHISMGVFTNEVYVLGKKNAEYINKLNSQENLFDKIVVLEHPRYIQQYKSKEKEWYICKYLEALQQH